MAARLARRRGATRLFAWNDRVHAHASKSDRERKKKRRKGKAIFRFLRFDRSRCKVRGVVGVRLSGAVNEKRERKKERKKEREREREREKGRVCMCMWEREREREKGGTSLARIPWVTRWERDVERNEGKTTRKSSNEEPLCSVFRLCTRVRSAWEREAINGDKCSVDGELRLSPHVDTRRWYSGRRDTAVATSIAILVSPFAVVAIELRPLSRKSPFSRERERIAKAVRGRRGQRRVRRRRRRRRRQQQ